MVGNQQVMPKNENQEVAICVCGMERQSLGLKIIASEEGKGKMRVLVISVTNLVEEFGSIKYSIYKLDK